MATDIWKGPGGTAGHPTSGDFFTAANWSGGVPDMSADAVFGAGDYTVTMNGAGAEVHSVNIGAGATVALSGNGAALVTDAASVNSGTILVSGATFYQSAGSLLNLGTIYGEVSSSYAGLLAGAVTNEGVISSRPGAGTAYFEVQATLLNDVDGLVTTLGGPGQVILDGTTTNIGRIVATGGGEVTTSRAVFGDLAHGTITNISGSTLSGGTWVAEANSSIWLAGTTISTLSGGATVTLDGSNSQFRVDDGSGDPFYLEQTLNLVGPGATLEVLGGRDWTTSETLDVRGTLHLGGGVFTPGDLRVEKDALLTGFGTITSQAIVDGLTRVDTNQTLGFTTFADFNGKITGAGTLALSGGSDTFTTSKVTVKNLLFDGADVQFDENLKYAGTLTVTTGTIELKDSKLTLTGRLDIGGAEIHGGPGGSLELAGYVRAHGGATVLSVRTIHLDTDVNVDHGSLAIAGTVSGDGGFVVGGQATLEVEAGGRLTGGPLVTLAGQGAALVFDTLDSNGARVAAFDGKDTIDFAALDVAGAKASWRADADGSGGTLKVSNGAETATVHLEENHNKKDFVLKDDGHGGTVVTLAKTAAFALVDQAAFGGDAHAPVGHLFLAATELHGGVLA